MLSWFGFSFVPLEWQPSFREFERLCKEEGGDTTTIYNQEAYERAKNTKNSKNISVWEDKMVAWRIEEAIFKNYERNTNILIESYKTFVWYDIGLVPKNERTVTCASIEKTKELTKQRWWLK